MKVLSMCLNELPVVLDPSEMATTCCITGSSGNLPGMLVGRLLQRDLGAPVRGMDLNTAKDGLGHHEAPF